MISFPVPLLRRLQGKTHFQPQKITWLQGKIKPYQIFVFYFRRKLRSLWLLIGAFHMQPAAAGKPIHLPVFWTISTAGRMGGSDFKGADHWLRRIVADGSAKKAGRGFEIEKHRSEMDETPVLRAAPQPESGNETIRIPPVDHRGMELMAGICAAAERPDHQSVCDPACGGAETAIFPGLTAFRQLTKLFFHDPVLF